MSEKFFMEMGANWVATFVIALGELDGSDENNGGTVFNLLLLTARNKCDSQSFVEVGELTE